MWRSKKLLIIAVLAAVVLAGSIGGIALAQTGSTDNTTSGKTLLARVAAILGIDQPEVEDAFAQAQSEMQEEALDNYLNNLVAAGKMTQEQADQFKAWWQARPDMTPYQQQLRAWQQARPQIPPELKEWQQARPDIPLPGPFRGHGGFRGMGGFRGWAGPSGPPLPPTSQTQ